MAMAAGRSVVKRASDTETIVNLDAPFKSLADYEEYRARIKADPESGANFKTAEEGQFILAEERTFLRQVEAG
jgi:hypothetical protein